ncbi:CD225/dispanin family protein [Streptomyces sp. NPDC006251]|uniref:CD225/dispanin family protein n=1 Tax=Streptomyces sp. NPDC006251 TaxID=3155718 RepID=UPI0033AEB32C
MADKRQPSSPDDESWGSGTPWQTPNSQQSHTPAGHQQFDQAPWRTQYPGQRTTPQTYMVAAILVTLVCFLPTGIAAIVFSSQVSSKIGVGDFGGAAESSRKARLWIIVSLVVGLIFWIVLIALSASTSTNTAYTPVP